jgi:hypothetical protein
MSPFPPLLEMRTNTTEPVATLYPVSRESPLPTNFQYRDVLPSAKVPLYNVLGLFPHISQRARFYQLLEQVQAICDLAQPIDDSLKNSHAFLFSSNSEIVKLGDMASLAIAMWRVYLYERTIVRNSD